MPWTTPETFTAGQTLTAASMNVLSGNANAGHPLVSTLPGSPSDGDTIYYQTTGMATDGIVWTLRYRSGGGTYKWEFVGGPPMYVEFATARTSTTTSYVALTDAVEITLPLAGTYLIEHGCYMGYTTGGPGTAETLATVKLGSAAAADAEAARHHQTVVNERSTVSRQMIRTLSAASSVIAQQYKAPAGVTITVADRWIMARPVVVG